MTTELHDLTRFDRRLEEASRQWQAHEAVEVRKALQKRARQRQIEVSLGKQLERCLAVLEALGARTLLESVRAAALPGAFVTHDACVTSGPAEKALGKESPIPPYEQQRQAQAASILTWGWPTPQGFVAIVVRGPVWWEEPRYRQYALGWSTDRLRLPGPDDDRELELRSWLDFRLDNIIGAAPAPTDLTRSVFRELLELELARAVCDGIVRP